MASIEDKLTSKLFRAFCPSGNELGEYHLGIASEEQARQIRQHLKTCPRCREELSQLKIFLNDTSSDVAFSPSEQIRVWVAKRIPTAPSGNFTPTFSVRGETHSLRQYHAGDAELTIEVQDLPQPDGHKNLIGLVMGIDTAGLQAHLWQDGQKISQTGIDELGNFVFQHQPPGSYDLILEGDVLEIHVQDIQV